MKRYIDAMLPDPYSDRLLAAASSIPAARRLDAPDATARRASRICGSELEVDLKLSGDVVADFGLEVRACALGQASASIVARNIVGARVDELLRLRDEMRVMLKDRGPAPTGARWSELEALSPIRDYPSRHASVLLVFEAVVAALDIACGGGAAGQDTTPEAPVASSTERSTA